MAIDLDRVVAGEPLRLLLRALAQMDMTPHADGGATVTGRLDPEPRAALLRALERIEAEPGSGGVSAAAGGDHTGAEARADAFTVLVQRITEAAGA